MSKLLAALSKSRHKHLLYSSGRCSSIRGTAVSGQKAAWHEITGGHLLKWWLWMTIQSKCWRILVSRGFSISLNLTMILRMSLLLRTEGLDLSMQRLSWGSICFLPYLCWLRCDVVFMLWGWPVVSLGNDFYFIFKGWRFSVFRVFLGGQYRRLVNTNT